jgi:hypothetical protein
MAMNIILVKEIALGKRRETFAAVIGVKDKVN